MPGLYPGVALVTGAASGIGRATAVAFAAEGCTKVAICDLSTEGLLETERLIRTKTEHGPPVVDVEAVLVDVSKAESVDSMIETVVKRWSRVDYVVNAAGIQGPTQRSTDLPIDAFDSINGVNYRGLWLCSRSQISQILDQSPLPTHDGRPGNRGAIVNIASQLGVVSRSLASAYCASKSAVISLTRSDAIDYSKDNIRINCVCPGLVETPMTQGTPEQREMFEAAVATAPLNRMGRPEEIADACLFLCSTKATFIQGTALLVDGGYVIS